MPVLTPPRIVVDPNSFCRHDPSLSVVLLRDCPPGIHAGDAVIADQPDDDGCCIDAPAVVDGIDGDLVYLLVDWNSATSYEAEDDE